MRGTSGVTPETFVSALASSAGLDPAAVEVTSATYTVEASVGLPVPFPDESTDAGQAARMQFRTGLQTALGLTSVDQVAITGVGRRRLTEEALLEFVAPPAQPKPAPVTINDRKLRYLSPRLHAIVFLKRAEPINKIRRGGILG